MTDIVASDLDLVALTADIVSAHVSHNNVATGDVATLIATVHSALAKAGAPVADAAPPAEPAVPIRSSVKQDYIVCLEDGAKLKMLKRYLHTKFDMSPEDYRAKWNLPRDYPMVAPGYAAMRADLAKKIGLGRKPKVDATPSVEPAAAAPAKGKKKLGIAAAKAAAAAPLQGA